ncbi:hypothetical protein Glove_168g46 [Diversispora epigaea]|uniref:Uncharacterized protein n=1 Tax=Diversispora epigaea TaxID=1348612 RepID=A0A397IXW3_9GLOM|nr:hypothetical protein Glove_168g46 [Diversispora epigaea]
MNKIKLFDKLEWSQMNAVGDEMDSRIYFSSALSNTWWLFIFCVSIIHSVIPKLATLDTNKNPFVWSSNSEVGAPPSIYGHTANLYNDNIIITFDNNRWVTTFSPPDNKTSTTTTFSKSLAIRLGTGIGALLLISCIFITIFIVRRTKQRSVILKMPGNIS